MPQRADFVLGSGFFEKDRRLRKMVEALEASENGCKPAGKGLPQSPGYPGEAGRNHPTSALFHASASAHCTIVPAWKPLRHDSVKS